MDGGIHKAMKTLIIVPAHNEEAGISEVICKIKQQPYGADILVVDDGSCDQTARLAKDAGAIVVSHPFNMGYGVALQTGYIYADRQDYDFIVQMDGDGQHDPKYIPDLLNGVGGGSADVAIGSRFLLARTYRVPITRRIGMLLFSNLVSVIIGQKITDSTSGFQALNKKAFRFFTSDIYPADYPDADVLIMLHRAGFRVKEVPLTMYSKDGGKSMHSGVKPVYYIFKMMLSILVTLMRKTPQIEKGG